MGCLPWILRNRNGDFLCDAVEIDAVLRAFPGVKGDTNHRVGFQVLEFGRLAVHSDLGGGGIQNVLNLLVLVMERSRYFLASTACSQTANARTIISNVLRGLVTRTLEVSGPSILLNSRRTFLHRQAWIAGIAGIRRRTPHSPPKTQRHEEITLKKILGLSREFNLPCNP